MAQLRRALGLPALTAYGLGTILGAGIYSVIGSAAALAGNALWWTFVVAGAVALLTALSYAELAAAYPRAGAEYVYLRRAAPRWRWLSVTVGLLVAASGAATAATVAIAFGGYLRELIALPALPIGLALLAGVTVINIIGIEASSRTNVVFTVIEVGGLALVIGLGAWTGRFGDAFTVAPSASVLPGAALVFFAFLGFDNIANLAEEAKRPERQMAPAILMSLAGATLLYVLVAVAALALVPPDELARTDAPLAAAARAVSPLAASILGVVALFATGNTALVATLVASRIVFGIANGGDLPSFLTAVLPKRKTPVVATVAVFALAALLLPLGSIGVVASVSSFASLLAFTAVNIAVVALRYRAPRRRRPFRTPIALGRFPVLPALGAIASLLLIMQLDRQALLIGVIILASLTATSVAATSLRRAREPR